VVNLYNMSTITIGNLTIGPDAPLAIIGGPCVAESRDLCMTVGKALRDRCRELGFGYIFKASFDKANRTSIHGKRGPGIDEGLSILARVRDEFCIPILTDVHLPDQCAKVAEVCDVLQIPAFLCRQTDLLVAAGETGKAVNIKKGQFLAPHDMAHVAEKVSNTGNDRILLTERGTSFGYNTLINDFRALPQMAATGYPVIFDATHSVQEPGGKGSKSGGNRDFVAPLARAACAIGVSGIFLETHQDPDSAPSDGPNMVLLSEMTALGTQLRAIDSLTKSF